MDAARLRDVAQAAASEIEPESDLHASADFRRHLSTGIDPRAVRKAAATCHCLMALPCPSAIRTRYLKLGEEHMVMTVVDEEKREHHNVVAVLKGEAREPEIPANEQQRAECEATLTP